MSEPKYHLVEFIEENTARQKTVDIVPSDWVKFDHNLRSLATAFMPPPYDEESSQTLHSMIRFTMPAPEDWPTFPIKLRGQAKNYKEASRKLKILNSKVTAFTSDDEMTAEQRTSMAIKKFQKENVEPEETQVDWNVPAIPIEHRQGKSQSLSSQHNGGSGLSSGKEPDTELEGPVLDNSLMNVIVSDCPPLEYEKLMSDITDEIKRTMKACLLPLEKHIMELSREIGCLRVDVNSLKSNYVQQPEMSSRQDHGFTLPLKEDAEFEEFDNILTNDEDRNEKIKCFIWQHVDPSGPLVESLRRVLRIFLTREVIEKYTAVKRFLGKKVFAQTHFFEELQSVLIRKYESNNHLIYRKDIEKILGRIFNAAKDWDGARQARTKTAKDGSDIV